MGPDRPVALCFTESREEPKIVEFDETAAYVQTITGGLAVPRSIAFATHCTPMPREVQGLRVDKDKLSGGLELQFTWDDDDYATSYVPYSDLAPDGLFENAVGTSASGSAGLVLPLPAETTFFLVAGQTIECGEGPLH